MMPRHRHSWNRPTPDRGPGTRRGREEIVPGAQESWRYEASSGIRNEPNSGAGSKPIPTPDRSQPRRRNEANPDSGTDPLLGRDGPLRGAGTDPILPRIGRLQIRGIRGLI